MRILHIDSSILGGHSVSRKLSAEIVAKLKAAKPDAEVKYLDLAATPLSHLSGGYVQAIRGPQPVVASDEDLAAGLAALEGFMAADVVVIGVGMYNFSISSQLKAWIDRIMVAGKTFRYSAQGPEGLVGNKRVILAIARGNFYGPGDPAAPLEHTETYLKTVFHFIGIVAPEIVIADGVNTSPEAREAAIKSALQSIAAIAA